MGKTGRRKSWEILTSSGHKNIRFCNNGILFCLLRAGLLIKVSDCIYALNDSLQTFADIFMSSGSMMVLV